MRATAWQRMPNRTSQRVEWLDIGLENVHYPIFNEQSHEHLDILGYWYLN